MDYSLSEPYERETWPVLLALRAAYLESGSKFPFDTDSAENTSRAITIGRLRYLERQDVLKYKPPRIDFVPDASGEAEISTADWSSNYPRIVAIELHEEKFKELYAEYSKVAEANEKVAQTQATSQKVSVRLMKNGLTLYLQASDGQRVDLNRFRADLTPEKLVDFLLAHANTIVPLTQIRLEGSGFHSVSNVAEILRKAGFTETVKKYFLPEADKDKVRLNDQADMTTLELEKIKAEMLKTKSE